MSSTEARIPKDLRGLARTARRRGWVITPNGSGHTTWTPPCGQPVYIPSSPHRNGHTFTNLRKRLARAGLK